MPARTASRASSNRAVASAPLAIESKGAVTSPYWEYDQ